MADRKLQVFYAVAKHGSFTRAAETLYMTQPAVTFQIKQLEEQFNIRLLDRGHGRVTLTPAGEIVFAYAERILGLSDEMETRIAELTDELTGVITIGTSQTIAGYWLPQLLHKFMALHPRVIPRVFVANSENIENRVASHELDVGLVEKQSSDPTLECSLACQDELKVIVAHGHPLAEATSLKATDLQGHSFVDRDPGAAIRALAEDFFRRNGVPPENLNRRAELGSLPSILHLVKQGLGFAIVAKAALNDYNNRGLVGISLDPPLYSSLNVLVPKDRFRARLHSTFAEFAIKLFSSFERDADTPAEVVSVVESGENRAS
ncbi:MAG: LysR family transcriptional regulator [Candidatus Dactylopiibacterium carminicum]|uniref:LysR family transcriptional regulator n=1 Tax=Candidatus Dactylopiibacterium carminicum TaxID=857335 RepID=A0A272EV19_9RHOO|nr:LysR family transcriptional regulator [Candidatus Dactylopiibacterium carminicum]KAF7599842.1 LysR family transcriptional regulator [Candidatus Dactylopiibacterium carminicum]PAS93953.1 MAG: LysR family transcriptional regulator [Candidatus Dactylopiibacterium carminicum]PAS97268.1 MAG: LysR family transcriptional regulator [Candidatus Dactylopiibacterium carminicum]PAS99842.1 MAG: LysR family transcriptional regulator [Candidatus Dactylopiibacterium carminicum]